MAIQMRRGDYEKFDPTRLLPGELAVVLRNDPTAKDGMALYLAFSAGRAKRLSTYEDMLDSVEDASADIVENVATELKSDLTQAVAISNAAAARADGAADDAIAAGNQALNIANSIAAIGPPSDDEVQELRDENATLATALVELQDGYIVLGETAYMPTNRRSALSGETITVAQATVSGETATLN